ncbi:MAG: hypothetical protein HKP62_03520, partial [Sulfurovum sp.]|nr:hypothetical protein [Sulfurovum sp.]NNJ45068.1 hypothetical protein [Sulfurovum sp.]
IKVGRQTLPKALSPFAYSENWNVFANTFDAALLVNTDIANTTLVYAFVKGGNANAMILDASDMSDFGDLNEDDGVHMLTVQNKSITDLTLTGSYYYAADFFDGANSLNILWGDAHYNAGSFNVGVQGGQIAHDLFDTAGNGDINSFGAKIAAALGPVNAELAYSNTNDGGVIGAGLGGVLNLGGTTSALYTSTMADELIGSNIMNYDADKWVVRGNMDALGGNIAALYAMTDSGLVGDTTEIDVAYTTTVADSLDLSAVYMYSDNDTIDTSDVVRVIANYKF